MNKINKLIRLNKNFMFHAIVLFLIFIAMFFIAFLFSLRYPLLMLLTVILIVPISHLFARILCNCKVKLERTIKKRLTNLVKKELSKEFEQNELKCIFDAKIMNFSNTACSFNICYCCTHNDFLKFYLPHVNKVRKNINDNLSCCYDVVFFPLQVQTVLSDIVV